MILRNFGRPASLALLVGALAAAGCDNAVTLPTPDEISQGYNVFSGPLDPNGKVTYLITVDTARVVSVMLAGAVAENPLRSLTPVLRVDIGVWDGTECQSIEGAETAPRFSAALQRQVAAGTYCVEASDRRGMPEQVGVLLRVTAPPVLGTGGTAGTVTFATAITPAGRAARSFDASVAGVASLTLTSVTPSNAITGLGIGLQDPGGAGCLVARVTTTRPGSTPQLSAQVDAGFYCAVVFDVGNFTSVQNFSLTIAYP